MKELNKLIKFYKSLGDYRIDAIKSISYITNKSFSQIRIIYDRKKIKNIFKYRYIKNFEKKEILFLMEYDIPLEIISILLKLNIRAIKKFIESYNKTL